MNNIGYGYETDEGVPKDYVKASKWYQQPTDQGTAVGRDRLNLRYLDGKGAS